MRSYSITIDPGYLNQIIRGIIKWNKCKDCDSNGIELQWYDDNGNAVPTGTAGAAQSDCMCDTCNGVGFIESPG
jgi:hypothetical protein